jgi:tight adherence protein B
MTPLFVALFTFVGAVAAGVGVTLFVAAAPDRPEARIRARLRMIRRGTAAGIASEAPLLKEERAGATAWPGRWFEGSAIVARLEGLLRRAELRVSAAAILLGSGGLALGMPIVLALVGAPVPVALVFGLVTAFAPYFYVHRRVTKRSRKFLEQMPDGLDTISQGLQAGLGLGHAQVFLAEEAPEPMKSEFSIFLQEMNFGLPLRDAVLHLEQRMPLHEVRLFSTALVVQREVGGSLSEVLTRLGDVIRDRFRIEQEIRSLTAQNRMTAWVVCSLPLVMAAAMFAMNGKLMGEVLGDPIGRTMLTMGAISWLVGALVFWRMLKIHV